MSSISQTPSIYQIRHIVSGKVYVGSAVSPRNRWRNHRIMLQNGNHPNRYLQNAWNKHGEAAFVFEILEPVLFIEDLITREQYWIDKLKASANGHGYNITPTAGSLLGARWTEEQRTRRVEQFKDPAFKAKYSDAKKAQFADPKQRARRSEEARALWRDPEYRARMTVRLKEGHADPEYKARVSANTRAAQSNPDLRRRMSESQKARFADPAVRARLSAQAKAKFASPDARAQLAERAKAMWKDPIYRARQMETRRLKRENLAKKKKPT